MSVLPLRSLGSDLCVFSSVCLLFPLLVPFLNNYGLAALVSCSFALLCFYEGLQPIFCSSDYGFDLPPRQAWCKEEAYREL